MADSRKRIRNWKRCCIRSSTPACRACLRAARQFDRILNEVGLATEVFDTQLPLPL